MSRAQGMIAGGMLVLALGLAAIALAAERRSPERVVRAPEDPLADGPTPAEPAAVHESLLYGRVTTVDGERYEGRLRWGGDEEAFWSATFDGFKAGNPWAELVSPERLLALKSIELFRIKIMERERPIELGRPFMARFGDIARIEPEPGRIRVTLKSGTEHHLDRFEADDLADGLRVWDGQHGMVDLGERQIREVELLAAPGGGPAPARLHGTVRTRQGELRGFIEWGGGASLRSDRLGERGAEGEPELRFADVRSILGRSDEGLQVRLTDGREVLLAHRRAVDPARNGIYVDDPRYGRVLVSWEAFERVDFEPAGAVVESGPGYDDFPPGRSLRGLVTTRDGRQLAGRLVYDLDESETTDTLDAPAGGLYHTLPFERVASIELPLEAWESSMIVHDPAEFPALVTLRNGEVLRLELGGDLEVRPGAAGLLVFEDGREAPEYVDLFAVERIELEAQ